MSSINITTLSCVAEWLKKNQSVFLATVINTWGASPRPVGSLFAFNATEKKQIGSLSGGCIEEHLIQYLMEIHECGNFSLLKPFLKRYGADDKDLTIFLPCGGVLELLIEPLSSDQDTVHILTLLKRLKKQQQVFRYLSFEPSPAGVIRSVLKQHQFSKKDPVLQFDPLRRTLLHRLDPTYRLLIVGAGDVAHHLIQAARSVEFAVTLCEPRTEILNRLPEAYRSNCSIENTLPDDLIKARFNDEFTAIVCLSHDPRVDDMALLEALENSSAFYIGAMGSVKTSEARRQRLQSLGLNAQNLARLHAPIGLNISSKTPSEIAISIIAELISKRFSP